MRLTPLLPLVLSCLSSAALARDDAVVQPLAQSDTLPRPPEEVRYRADREPILLVAEGLSDVVPLDELRARLSALFGRPVVALSDRGAGDALATLWVSANEREVVVRLSGFERSDLWQRIPREGLGSDAATAIANAVLEMLFSERLDLSRSSEMLDPFCARGNCREDSRARRSRRRPVDPSVLDPWDGAYQRFAPLDPLTEPPRYHDRDDPFAAEPQPPVRPVPSSSVVLPALAPTPSVVSKGAGASPWALDLLGGAGVYEPGGFVRYEVDVLRRLARFDVGVSFLGGRGQPDARNFARRTMAALVQRRFVMEGLEIDLGASFGVLTSQRPSQPLEARPYLRGLTVFAIGVAGTFDVLLQSELGTTFAEVDGAGVVEYALALGPRIGL